MSRGRMLALGFVAVALVALPGVSAADPGSGQLVPDLCSDPTGVVFSGTSGIDPARFDEHALRITVDGASSLKSLSEPLSLGPYLYSTGGGTPLGFVQVRVEVIADNEGAVVDELVNGIFGLPSYEFDPGSCGHEVQLLASCDSGQAVFRWAVTVDKKFVSAPGFGAVLTHTGPSDFQGTLQDSGVPPLTGKIEWPAAASQPTYVSSGVDYGEGQSWSTGIKTLPYPADCEGTPVVPKCQGTPATIWGTEGDDVLLGTSGRDVIVGRGGNDTIRGKGGNDLICGGSGADTLLGGDGRDTIFGGSGADTIDGGSKKDVIDAGSGKDVVSGGSGGDEIVGGGGKDEITGGPGADTIYGNGKGDKLIGDDGDDKLFGGSGSDTLKGKAGDDTLKGGTGDDTCVGGSGVDTGTACETEVSIP